MKTYRCINVLLKGTASSIQKALSQTQLPEHKFVYFDYDPNKIDVTDNSIKILGIVFSNYEFEKDVPKEKLPFVELPDIKFLCMSECFDRLDEHNTYTYGTYAVFKDFNQSNCQFYRFSNVTPCYVEEGLENSEDFEAIRESFLWTSWEFEYFDDSDGITYKFAFGKKKKDLEIIHKWDDDSAFSLLK